jgi:hypothetical protein
MPNGSDMKTSTALSQMYKIFTEAEGPVMGRETLISILHIVLSDLESEGLEVTDELLDERLTHEALKIFKASKKIVA